MKKRLLSIFLAFVLITGLMPLSVYASRGSHFIHYVDAVTLEPIQGEELFKYNAIENFILKGLDGIIFTVEGTFQDGWVKSGAGIFTLPFDKEGFLQSYPIPNGYEVVDVYCVDGYNYGGYKKECHQNCNGSSHWVANDADIFILVRKSSSSVPQPTPAPITTAKPKTATPTASTVLVNGKNIAFDAYNIDGNNYFKLRDLAYILNGTQKQFQASLLINH